MPWRLNAGGGLNVGQSSHPKLSSLTGPADRGIVGVLTGVVPAHPVTRERVPGRAPLAANLIARSLAILACSAACVAR